MRHTVDALTTEYDVTLIGPKGCAAHCPQGVRVIECPPGLAGFLGSALLKGLPHCLRSKYDRVLGGSGLVAPLTTLFSRLSGARSAIFVHGLDLVVKSQVYQRLFLPFIRRHDIVVANSSNTQSIAVGKGVAERRLHIINPGAQFPDSEQLQKNNSVRGRFAPGNEKLLLFVGRIIRRKGLAGFLQHAWPIIAEQVPEARLLVVGDTPDAALMRDKDEAREVSMAMRHLPQESVRFLGAVDDRELWQCYAAADLLVFPLLEVDGDVEGFGMVAVEAAASGTATVAFGAGGVVDAVKEGVSGFVVTPGDYQAFADTTVRALKGEKPDAAACRSHAAQFSWDRHRQQLMELLRSGFK